MIVSSGRDRPYIVWIEPWGEDYTILPTERLEVIARSRTTEPWFNPDEYEEGVQIYIEGPTDVEFEVLKGGQKVECGHQREFALRSGLSI